MTRLAVWLTLVVLFMISTANAVDAQRGGGGSRGGGVAIGAGGGGRAGGGGAGGGYGSARECPWRRPRRVPDSETHQRATGVAIDQPPLVPDRRSQPTR